MNAAFLSVRTTVHRNPPTATSPSRLHPDGTVPASAAAYRAAVIRPIAVIALCTGLLCTACAGDPAPASAPGPALAPGTGAGNDSPAPAGVSQSAAQVSKPFVLARNLSVPGAIAFLPGGDALVTERDSARLLRVTPHGRASTAGPVSTVGTVPGVAPDGEGGLLGVAVSPSFGRDRLVYLYVSTATDNRIVRFRYASGGIGPLEAVVTGIPRASIHNGGRLAFGPDGMLWASTGEHAEPGLSQDRTSLGGKILRMTPDGRPAPGNPFGTLVWSYGHRNVQGMAWDGQGQMYATELGQDRFDEINKIQKGRNYGWPEVEGAGGGGAYADPELTWPTDQASPSGAAIAAGSIWVAALRGERLWQVPLDDTGALGTPVAHFTGEYGRLREVVRAPDGSLWFTTSNRDGRGSPRPDDDMILVIQPR